MPEDVSGTPTYAIVRQKRCETRQAIIENALGWLTSETNLSHGKVDPESHRIGIEFRNGRPIQEFTPSLFNERVGQIIATFYDAGVAYTFDLQMAEMNKLKPMIDLSNIFPHFVFTMGITGGFDRTRTNERIFTVTDSFSGLIRLPDDYCNDTETGRNYVVSENHVYPITGKISIKRMIQDFIEDKPVWGSWPSER